MSMMLRRAMMVPAVVPGGLPSEYLQVEYLRSTNNGGQYIDTGLSFDDYTKAVIKFAFPEKQNYQCPFGAKAQGFCLQRNSSADYLQAQSFGTSTQMSAFTVTTGAWIETELTPTTCTHEGTTYNITKGVQAASTFGTIWLFGKEKQAGGALDVKNAVDIAYFQIYSGNVLLHDYVPCIRIADSKPGMYDLVGRQFYVNQGTGEFIAGHYVLPYPVGTNLYNNVVFTTGERLDNTGE